MHCSSYQNMEMFVSKYLKHIERIRIADIGSKDISGSYKRLSRRHEGTGKICQHERAGMLR
jgi:hypothetical protein